MGKLQFTEFKKNIGLYQKGNKSRVSQLTNEQKEFIRLCRDCENQVSYSKMVGLWSDLGWGKIARSSLQEYSTVLLKDKKK